MQLFGQAISFILGIVFPIYFLARSAFKGWLEGFVVRAPAKIFITALGLAVAHVSGQAALHRYPDLCRRFQYGTAVFLPTFLVIFCIVMLIARKWSAEWQFSNALGHDRWSLAIRIVDGIAGVALELVAGAFILGFVFTSLQAPSPVISALEHPAIAASNILPGWANGVTLWNDSWSKIAAAVGAPQVGHQIPQSAFCDSNAVQLDSEDIDLLTYLWMLTLAPLAAVLSFESLAYFGENPTIGSTCASCRGGGRSRNPLLLGSLCDTCGGYGKAEVRNQTITTRPLNTSLLVTALRAFAFMLVAFAALFVAWASHGGGI